MWLIKREVFVEKNHRLIRPEREVPYIQDVPGDDIKFVNPRYVWYASGIYPDADGLTDVVSINRKETILSFHWGLPPWVVTEPAETEYTLGDGYFGVYCTKGGQFSSLGQWKTPVGRATTLNTGQIILYIVDLVIGELPIKASLVTLPNHIHIKATLATQLTLDITQHDTSSFLIHFCDLVRDNTEEIAFWIWQETNNNATHTFINSAADLLEKVTFILQLLGFANEQAPFCYNLAFAPYDVTYYITQEDGEIVGAGIILPGELDTDFDYDYYNYITDQNLPLVSGLPDQLDHNYASHESFSNLADGTTVYCVNEEDEAAKYSHS